MFRNKNRILEASGGVRVGAQQGLTTHLARAIQARAVNYESVITIDNGRGVAANAHSLLELLLLGTRMGEHVHVRCAGPDAKTAYAELTSVLIAGGGA